MGCWDKAFEQGYKFADEFGAVWEITGYGFGDWTYSCRGEKGATVMTHEFIYYDTQKVK